MMIHACNPSYSEGGFRKIVSFEATSSKVSETVSLKQNKKNKRTGGVSQEVEWVQSPVPE
jgi:predicted FMN-binding regulatory protein PaiB